MTLNAVFSLDDFVGFDSGFSGFYRVVEPRFESVSKGFWCIGFEGGSAMGFFNDFGEGTVVRLNNGDASCEGFNGVKAKGFRVASWYGEYG